MSPEQMLREFHQSKAIHGGLSPGRPSADVPPDVRDLRIALLAEEVEELRLAMLAGDLTAIADGIADVVFVAVGSAVPYGIPFDAVFREVWRSNCTKTNETPEAKLTKGPGYEPPDIAAILARAAGGDWLEDLAGASKRAWESKYEKPGGSMNPTPDCGGPRKPPGATECWWCQDCREFHEPAKDRTDVT